MDENGTIIIIIKARLFAQGYMQEEGIDFDEIFAPVARLKAIKIFLSCATYTNFTVYQMNVKRKYIRDLLKKYEVSNSALVKTPMVLLNKLGLDLSGQSKRITPNCSEENLQGTQTKTILDAILTEKAHQVEHAKPPKDSVIKFTMKNGKMPLSFNFKIFTRATGLDYNKGKDVDQP
nr:retrovirus-related Pol polyprotein from transposon TNT 1-94 [Tanacetum cinerariifolium]